MIYDNDDLRVLDDEFVRKHARPGENWDQARSRLNGEVAERFFQLPGCVICSVDSSSVEEARSKHGSAGIHTCRGLDEGWPAVAIEPEQFMKAIAQHQHRTEDLSAIARNRVNDLLHSLRIQNYPINAYMVSRVLDGYLQSCSDLGLFDNDELYTYKKEMHELSQKAREAFIKQFRENDQSALPWR